MTGPQLQAMFDAEGETIERGRRALLLEQPAGQPSMLGGTLLVLAIFALTPFIAALAS